MPQQWLCVFGHVMVVVMVLGSVVLGQPALAKAATSATTSVPPAVMQGLPPGAVLDAAQPAAASSCVEEGFFPDPTDQKKFRYCVDDGTLGGKQAFRFDCAPGKGLWCQALLTCTFSFQCPPA